MAKAPEIELPDDQEFFKLNEVCKLANVQPYMLRFWGTEFEQLETTTTETGQRLYSRPQMQLILEIRRLLFDEGLTIAGARKQIDDLVEKGTLNLESAPARKPAQKPVKKKPARKKAPAKKPKAKPKKKPEPKSEPEPQPEPEPEPVPEPEPEVDKTPQADVQPLLTTLRGVRKELAEIVEELKSSD